MAGKIITWNGVSSEGLPGLIIGQINRGMIGKPRTRLMEIAGKSGAYVFPQPRGTRIVTAEMAISTAAGEDHDEAVEEFAVWLDVENEAKLKIGGSDRYYLGVVRDDPEPDEWRGLSKFQVVWECQPHAFSDDVSTESWSGGSGTNHIWDAQIASPVQPVIVIQPTNGTLTGFVLSVNGYGLTVGSLTVADDQFVTVNGVIPAVLYGPNDDVNLTGAFDPSDLAMAGTSGEFPWLLPGAGNQVSFTKTGGTATAFQFTTNYRKVYRR